MSVHEVDFSQREAPGNVEAEQALLGGLLTNNGVYELVAGTIEPGHFGERLHGKIWEAATNLIEKGQPANPVTVKTFLPSDELIGDMTVSQYLARLSANAVSLGNAQGYAEAIRRSAGRRNALSLGDALVDAAFDQANEFARGGDPTFDEILEAAQVRLEGIRNELSGREELTGGDIAESYFQTISKETDALSGEGVPFCLPELGTILSDTRFRPGRLYGLLSSSGEGKTSLVMQIIHHALTEGHPVVFISYDQNWKECIAQMAAQNLGIEFRRQMQRDLSSDEVEQCLNFALEVGKLPFEVIECTNETVAKQAPMVKRSIKKLRRISDKTPLVVTDHMQAITPRDKNADEGTKARGIGHDQKSLMKQTGSAGLLIQQRSSAGMKRPNPRPTVHDVYGGQAAIQPFDAIAYIFRAEKFRREQLSVASGHRDVEAIQERFPLSTWEGKAELGAVKVRFGDPSIRRRVEWESTFTRYRSVQNTDQGDLAL